MAEIQMDTKVPWQVGKLVEVLPEWIAWYELEAGRRYPITGVLKRYFRIDIGEPRPLRVEKKHVRIVDGSYSGDL